MRAYNSIEQHALDIAKNINDVTVFVINGDKIKEGKDFCAKLKRNIQTLIFNIVNMDQSLHLI